MDSKYSGVYSLNIWTLAKPMITEGEQSPEKIVENILIASVFHPKDDGPYVISCSLPRNFAFWRKKYFTTSRKNMSIVTRDQTISKFLFWGSHRCYVFLYSSPHEIPRSLTGFWTFFSSNFSKVGRNSLFLTKSQKVVRKTLKTKTE